MTKCLKSLQRFFIWQTQEEEKITYFSNFLLHDHSFSLVVYVCLTFLPIVKLRIIRRYVLLRSFVCVFPSNNTNNTTGSCQHKRRLLLFFSSSPGDKGEIYQKEKQRETDLFECSKRKTWNKTSESRIKI